LTGSNDFSNPTYLKLDADEKMDKLWAAVSADQNHGSFPNPLELATIFLESMEPSFHLPGDEFNSGLFTRHKLIHSVAAHG